MTIWHVIGAIAALLTMFSFVPQIVKILKTRCAHDVSVFTLVQLACGVTLWIIYGVYLKDPIIIACNCVTLASMVVLLLLYRKYGGKTEHI